MKYIVLASIVAMVVFPTYTYAGCADYRCDLIGPPPVACPDCYYTFDLSCASTSGVTEQSMSCYSWSAHQWALGSGDVTYSMTVPDGHGSSCKDVRIFVDFSDPAGYAQDGISATVYVRHNGSVTYVNGFFFHNGNQGSLQCARFDSGTFSASAGDTIEVTYTGTNYTGATMKISAPVIFD